MSAKKPKTLTILDEDDNEYIIRSLTDEEQDRLINGIYYDTETGRLYIIDNNQNNQ